MGMFVASVQNPLFVWQTKQRENQRVPSWNFRGTSYLQLWCLFRSHMRCRKKKDHLQLAAAGLLHPSGARHHPAENTRIQHLVMYHHSFLIKMCLSFFFRKNFIPSKTKFPDYNSYHSYQIQRQGYHLDKVLKNPADSLTYCWGRLRNWSDKQASDTDKCCMWSLSLQRHTCEQVDKVLDLRPCITDEDSGQPSLDHCSALN